MKSTARFDAREGREALLARGGPIESGFFRQEAELCADAGLRANLSVAAQRYLKGIGGTVEELFHFVLGTLHDAGFSTVNVDGLRLGWPRIPLPGWSEDADEVAAGRFAAIAERGRELARLLDPEAPVPGVTIGDPGPEVAVIAVPTKMNGHQMSGDDFAPARHLLPSRRTRHGS